MKRYQTLLLDADRTLLDFDTTEKKALRKTFQKYGFPFTPEIESMYLDINKQLWADYEKGLIDRNTVIYKRFGELFAKVGIDGDGVAFEDDYQAELGRGHDLMPYAMEVVTALEKEFDLYIVTNGVVATQYSRLHDAKLDLHFKKIFVSEECGYQKPQKEFFDFCFQHIDNLELSKTLIVGDSLSSDIQGGNNAGIATCWFNPTNMTCATEMRIDHEIYDLRQLYEIVGKDEE